MRETYLDTKHTEVKELIKELLKTVVFPQLITLVLDGWTNVNNTSVWVMIAVLPHIGPVVLETINASAESHTGEWIAGKDHMLASLHSNSWPAILCGHTFFAAIAGRIKKLLNSFGPKNFGAIVSDNGGGCEKGRQLAKEAFPHLVVQRYHSELFGHIAKQHAVLMSQLLLPACRCMMHEFALIMGSTFAHKVPLGVISKCQKLVTATKQSHKLKHWVHDEYEYLKQHSSEHKKITWLVQAATTRFSTTYNCMLSVLNLEKGFKSVAAKHKADILKIGTVGQKQVLTIIEDKKFWRDLETYTPLAEPYNQVCVGPSAILLLACLLC